MSTPVPREKTKVASGEDLERRMQAMIDLQNEELKLSQHESSDADQFYATTMMTTADRKDKAQTKMSRATGRQSLHELHQQQQQQEQTMESRDALMPTPQKMGSSVRSSGGTTTASGSDNIFASDHDQGVGQGTLYINSEKLGSGTTGSSAGNTPSYHHQSNSYGYDDPGQVLTSEERRLMTAWPGTVSEVAAKGGYGTVNSSSNMSPPPPPPPPSSSSHQQNPYPYLNTHNPHQHHQQHQFHYGNPDYNKGQKYQQPPPPPRGGISGILSVFRAIGNILVKMFYMACCCCSTDAIEQQQLNRSFCYGAIDGMLTGSGIVAGFCGMNLLAPTSILAVRTFVVAFSAAACFADSLCMALGHVWTTYVLVSTSARERAEQRLAMEHNKADAKGKLVDMLLERGMLKIDAMSLADTLEGYPDMFVSALVGDALIAGGVGGAGSSADSTGSDSNSRQQRSISSGGNKWGGPGYAEDYPRYAMDSVDEPDGQGGFLNWKFPSYGQRMHELESQVEPEAAFVSTAMTESRREGLFMMLGFSVFAIVPSLIYLTIPMVIQVDQHMKRHSSKEDTDDIIRPAGGISASSIMVTIAAVIMWSLGVWKSQFLDSNWMMFGIETVVVLLVCIGAAYGSGAILAYLIPEINASILFYAQVDDSTEEL